MYTHEGYIYNGRTAKHCSRTRDFRLSRTHIYISIQIYTYVFSHMKDIYTTGAQLYIAHELVRKRKTYSYTYIYIYVTRTEAQKIYIYIHIYV